MKQPLLVCLLLLLSAFFFSPSPFVSGEVARGTINAKSDFVFLARFCYDTSGNGTFFYTIHTESENLVLLLYDDVKPRDWETIRKNKASLTCEEKKEAALGVIPIVGNKPSTVIIEDKFRPHFWWFAVSNCGQGSTSFSYDIHMTNFDKSYWRHEVSFDKQGIEGLYLFWFLVFIIGVVIHLLSVISLKRTRSYHTIVRLLSTVIISEFISVLFFFCHTAVYASNGLGVPGLAVIADLLDIFAQVTLILMLVLIASGWTITKMQLGRSRTPILIVVGVLSIVYFAMFIYEYTGFDPSSTLYLYESPAGIVVIIMRGVVMLWFVYNLRDTYKEENHPGKRWFYSRFGTAYTIWFLILPFITIVAAMTVSYMRMKTVLGMYVTTNALALAGLGFLLWPTRASEYFMISSHLDISGSLPYGAI